MTPTQALATAVVIWIVIGVTASVVMGRRGHDPFTWLLVGAGMGPLAVPLAIRSARGELQARSEVRELTSGQPGAGDVDVLVGIDGSSRSIEALRAVEELLGERIGRMTLATVLTHEEAEDQRAGGRREAIEAELARAARLVPSPRPATVVLAGKPSAALVEHALDHGYRLLVVGRRGGGASKRVLGSTAASLSEDQRVPVLIV